MYDAGFQHYVDAVGMHAPGYSAPEVAPEDGAGGHRFFTFRHVEDLRRIMVANGDAAHQVALLEVGWTTDQQNPDYSWFAVDEPTQARNLVAAYRVRRRELASVGRLDVGDLHRRPDLDARQRGMVVGDHHAERVYSSGIHRSGEHGQILRRPRDSRSAIPAARRRSDLSPSILAISYFFHLIATIVWIGGLVILMVMVLPEARRVLGENPAFYTLLARLRQRFFPLSNFSLALLVVTGLIQMSGDPHYDGVLQFTNEWSKVILLKHVAIAGMFVCGLALQYWVAPVAGTGDAAGGASQRRPAGTGTPAPPRSPPDVDQRAARRRGARLHRVGDRALRKQVLSTEFLLQIKPFDHDD